MSYVLTTKQLLSTFSNVKSYISQFVPQLKDYRLAESGLTPTVFQRIVDAVATSDSAYQLEEAAMLSAWLDGDYGVRGAGRLGSIPSSSDKAFLKGWYLHKLPSDFLNDWPSPYEFLRQNIEDGHVEVLPQEPQKRVKITGPNGEKRSIRVK